MIYLIESSAFKRKSNGEKEYFQLLKIGYTDDDKKEKRYSGYKLHNPTCEILCEILNATEEHEHKLHYKFKNYRYEDYGNEWFYYNEEIVNYIKTVALEELDKLPNSPNKDMKNSLKGKKEAKKIISYLFDTVEEVDNYLLALTDKLGDTISYTTALDYISQDSTIDQDKLKNYYEIKRRSDTGIYTENKIINEEVGNFLRVYNNFHTMYDKLRYLCESPITQEAKEIILAQIPDSDEIKSYYTTIGPQRLYELGYSITKIKKELGIVTFSQELLINSIYSNFKIGNTISLNGIKLILTSIYSSINYKKTPKAVDLLNYFKVEEVVTSEKKEDGNRKRVRCYKLVESYEQKLREDLKYSN